VRGLLDTSVVVALEVERAVGRLPDEAALSVITLEELSLGVRMAEHRGDAVLARRRQDTLDAVGARFEALPVTDAVALACAAIRAAGRQRGLRLAPFDALIAATAAVHGLPLYTQDAALARVPLVDVRLV